MASVSIDVKGTIEEHSEHPIKMVGSDAKWTIDGARRFAKLIIDACDVYENKHVRKRDSSGRYAK